MNASTLGVKLARERLAAGLSQTELAARMETTQSVISRLESGRVSPTLEMVERHARALGRPITVVFGPPPGDPPRDTLRARVRRVLGGYVFDPWERNPSEAEARSLIADGLTRESFERPETASAGESRG